MRHEACPSCASNRLRAFFRVNSAPVFSLVTVKSKDEALAVPRKDIELALCLQCGFIFNRLFDTSIDHFSGGYEDQQAFSKTFMDYLRRLSADLVRKYGLQGKNITEIGCGKGDFLNLLVETSGGKGVGIDPAYREGRQSNPDLTFHRSFYAMEHGNIPADALCCRHTLEHVHDTRGFLRLLRQSLGSHTAPVIFFEVPEIKRILEVGAFWDIYYEHCSYFSPGSLARLFRSAGFEVLDLRLDYQGQYLLIEAKPSPGAATPATHENEETVADIELRVSKFARKIDADLGDWRNTLVKLKERGAKTVVWGGGSKSVGFLVNFADLDLIQYVVDVNPHMEGNFIPGIGKMYVQPSFLRDYRPDAVIIMNGIYKNEISKSLHDMGLHPEIHAL
jgi:Methyltransferase domain/C-methyltransferase C-terminal domain